MAEPFTVSAHASKANIDVWAKAQGANTRIESKVGQDGQTVLYAKKMGRFEALFHKTTQEQHLQTARGLVDRALKTDPPAFAPSIQGGGQRMLSLGKLSELPEEFRNSGAFKTHLANLGKALVSGDAVLQRSCGEKLADAISHELRKQPFSGQMRFALADPNTLAKELLSTVVDTTRDYLQKSGGDEAMLPPDRLEVLGGKAKVLTDSIDRVMAGLSDCALSDKEIRINGHSYLREEKPLGNGAFGEAYLYRAAIKGDLKPGEPETLVVKTPTDALGPDNRDTRVNGPLREARALVNASGSGGAEFSGNVARFHSAIRGVDGKALLVMRLEEGGSAKGLFKKAINRLGSLDSNKKISEKQYEDMTLTLLKDAVQGTRRFHEGGQVAHFDLKIDNLLISKDGTGRVADPGASRGLGHADELDSPANIEHLTPIAYTAPEKFLGAKATAASDVFTLGMTLLESLSKNGPVSLFENRNTHPLFTGFVGQVSNQDIQNKVMAWSRNPNAVMLQPGSVPPGSLLAKYADLINWMTSPSPGKRPTLEQVLAHPLFNQPGQGSAETRELIKSLAIRKPAVREPQPRMFVPTLGYVGDNRPSNQALNSVPPGRRMTGEDALPPYVNRPVNESSGVLRSLDEVRDDSILAYGPRDGSPSSRMSGTFESMELPEGVTLNSQPPVELQPINNYVSVALNPGEVRTGPPNAIVPGEERELHEVKESPSNSSLRSSQELTRENSVLRGTTAYGTENPINAYDGKLETTDDGVTDGKREIPEKLTPPRNPYV